MNSHKIKISRYYLQSYLRFEQMVDTIDGHILEELVHDEHDVKAIDQYRHSWNRDEHVN